MPKFRKKPCVVEAEQFHAGDNPDTYPAGVRWGGDLPDGTGCYVVGCASPIRDVRLADGDWVVDDPHRGGRVVYKPDVFVSIFEPAGDPAAGGGGGA